MLSKLGCPHYPIAWRFKQFLNTLTVSNDWWPLILPEKKHKNVIKRNQLQFLSSRQCPEENPLSWLLKRRFCFSDLCFGWVGMSKNRFCWKYLVADVWLLVNYRFFTWLCCWNFFKEKYRLVLMLFKQLSIIIKVQSELLFKSSILTSESILDW